MLRDAGTARAGVTDHPGTLDILDTPHVCWGRRVCDPGHVLDRVVGMGATGGDAWTSGRANARMDLHNVVDMALKHLQDAPRCTARTKHGENAGQRCKKPALAGTELCRSHGGTLPAQQKKREVEMSRREAVRREIKPLDRGDRRGNGDAALAEELRRTIGWIDFCEDQLNQLGVPYDANEPAQGVAEVLAGLQVSKRETVGAAEFAGVNVTEIVGVNVWEEKLRWNRAHLAVLTKQWLAAGFEARRLELARESIERIERMVNGVARDLGHNAADPEVRRVVRDRIRRELSEEGDSDGA